MRDILFMGTVLASVTHEMQNVIAIIKESGALTDDILKINGPPRMKHGDKLAVALNNIQEQVDRGRRLMLMLNSFAHAAADYPERADLLRFTRQICVLAERMARLKDCGLQLHLDGPHLIVRGNALLLMQSVYCAVAQTLAICQGGDTLHVTALPPEGEGRMCGLRICADMARDRPDAAILEPIMEEQGGFCRTGEGLVDLLYMQAEEGPGE